MNLALVPKDKNLIDLLTILIIVIAILVGGGALYMFFVKKNFVLSVSMFIVGAIVILLVYQFWPITSAVLIMNEQGINDRRLGVGVIDWFDIEEVQIEHRYQSQFICMRLRDPEKYIARLSGDKLIKMRDNQKLGFNMLNIDVSAFEVDPLQLMEHVRKTSAQHRKSRSDLGT